MDGLTKEYPLLFRQEASFGHVRKKSQVGNATVRLPVMDQESNPKVRDFAFQENGALSDNGTTMIPRRRGCNVDRSISTSKMYGSQLQPNTAVPSRRSQTAWARTSLGLTPIDTQKLRSQQPSVEADPATRATSGPSRSPDQPIPKMPSKAPVPSQGSDSTTETVLRTMSSSKWDEAPRVVKVASPTPAPTGPLPPLPENRGLASALQLMPLPPTNKKTANDKPLPPIVLPATRTKDKHSDR